MAYKRECFGGKGLVARVLDRVFLSILGALGVYVLLMGKPGRLVLSLFMGISLGVLLVLLDNRRFKRFMAGKEKQAADQLRLLHFIQKGGEGTLPEGEKAIFSLKPVTLEALQGRCLLEPGQVFRLYQKPDTVLVQAAEALGCRVRFCPEVLERMEVSGEEVEEFLTRQAPVRREWGDWQRKLSGISGKRFLLAGGLMTLLSFFLPYSLFFRLLGTAAFVYGSVSLSLSLVRKG